ncbi:hypothetical protein ABMA27_001673 [Loxostege sticticalis]|uniref:Thioredoxin domain-containing protein n=1 Tax=Loxostege sticticalis TaxID=481309 RepID=A0ABR3HZB5_LOXSC
MCKSVVLVFFIFSPYFVAPENGFVYDYNPSNFKDRIEEMDGNFIMFFAPWCRHCTDFHPTWQELGKLVNTKDSKFAIAQVDCTQHFKLCQENDITGYPTLLYFHKNTFTPVEYKGTRDLPSLTIFLSEVFTMKSEKVETPKDTNDVKVYSGMAYLNDQNIEKFISNGQHFIMFYAPWCKASQRLAPVWAELAVQYAHNEYIQIGKVNCMENEMTCKNFDIKLYPYLLWVVNGRIMGVADANSLEDLKAYVEKMVLAENHDPEKFMKKKKALPVARISEETFETFLEKDLVFINYFAPWCAHCMQLGPLWLKLGEKFQNESRVLIADVDCVRSKPICETEKINGLPTLILYKHKKIVNVEHGSRPLESLISLVNEHLQESSDTSEEIVPSDDNSKNQSEETKQTKDEL